MGNKVSIHLILSIVAYLVMKLYPMDVKNTFLNKKLDKEIYMDQSTNSVVSRQKHKVFEP